MPMLLHDTTDLRYAEQSRRGGIPLTYFPTSWQKTFTRSSLLIMTDGSRRVCQSLGLWEDARPQCQHHYARTIRNWGHLSVQHTAVWSPFVRSLTVVTALLTGLGLKPSSIEVYRCLKSPSRSLRNQWFEMYLISMR